MKTELDDLMDDAQDELDMAVLRMEMLRRVDNFVSDLAKEGFIVEAWSELEEGHRHITIRFDPDRTTIIGAGLKTPEPSSPPPLAAEDPAEDADEAPEAVAEEAPLPVAEDDEPDDEPIEPEPEIGPDGYVKGPFTDAEIETIVDMSARGEMPKEIAEYLGRKVTSVSQRKTYLMAKIDQRMVELKAKKAAGKASEGQGRAVAKEPPAPVATAQVATAKAPPPAQDAPGADVLTVAERHINQRIASLGYPAPWSPELDLKFVARIVRGDGMGAACEEVGVSFNQGRARWKEMLPEVTIEGQRQLATVLRWRFENIPGDSIAAE